MEIFSIFEVTEFGTKNMYEETILGCGQDAISYLRKQYPFYTKFVLKGFEINGKYIKYD